MRSLLAAGSAVLVVASWAQNEQQTFDAAKALGQAQAQQTMSGLKDGSAQGTVQSTVPNYTSNPSQTQYYSNKNLSGGTAQLQAQCQNTPNDPTCAGISKGTAPRPQTDLSYGSPALASQAAVENPTSVLGDVAQTYNACSTGGAMLTPAVWEHRTCTLDAPAWSDATCTKTLTSDPLDSYSCLAGDTLAYVEIDGKISIKAVCDPTKGAQVPFTFYAWGSHGACNGPQTVTLDLSKAQPQPGSPPPIVAEVVPHWHGGCFPMEVSWTGQGCQDLVCKLTVHIVQPPGVVANYGCNGSDVLGSAISWLVDPAPPGNMCYAGYPDEASANGQPGYYGVVGDYAYFFVATTASTYSGWSWAGGEHYAADIQFPQPLFKPAAGDIWTSTCKPYEDKTSFLPADGVNPSQPPVVPVATALGQEQCVRKSSICTDGPSTKIIDGIAVTRECWAYSNVFSCTALDQPSTCSDASYQSCSIAGAPECLLADTTGHCVSAKQGYDCKVADATFAPALNCGASTFCAGGSCWDTTNQPNDQFSYAIAQMEAHIEAGKDFDSTTLQIFKGTDSRCHQDNFGIDNCCEDSAYLQQCTQAEQDTVQKRDAGKCHATGEYCSSKVLGICKEHTHTYCCFSSLLARVIQEQGRAQIGRDWGTPEAPNCVGFTPDELAKLDWSLFDLSEFYAQINPTTLNQGQVTNGAAGQQPACYYGQGRC